MKNVFKVLMVVLILNITTGYATTSDLNQEQKTFIDADVGDMVVNVEIVMVQSFDFVGIDRDVIIAPDLKDVQFEIVAYQIEDRFVSLKNFDSPIVEKPFRFARDGIATNKDGEICYNSYSNRLPRDGIRTI